MVCFRVRRFIPINPAFSDGHTYLTTPGSALLFPTLCKPTGDVPARAGAGPDRCGDRTAMMPLRTSTRAQNEATASTANADTTA
jgi:hypothetical protein